MVTQTIYTIASPGLTTPTMKLFNRDTLLGSSIAVPGANNVSLYSGAFTDIPEGRPEVQVWAGGSPVSSDFVTLTLTTGSFDGESLKGSGTLENQEELLDKFDTATVFSLVLTSGQYCDQELLELLVGASNLQKWANLENGDVLDVDVLAKIDERITLAIARAESQTDDLLRGTRYAVPIHPVSVEMASTVAGLAACFLYEARGALEFDQQLKDVEHQLAFYRQRYDRWIRGVVGGKIRLGTQTVGKKTTTTPQVR